jgi:hypothetical protein
MTSYREPFNVREYRHYFLKNIKNLKHPKYYERFPNFYKGIEDNHFDYSKKVNGKEYFQIAGFYMAQGNYAGIFGTEDSDEILFYDYGDGFEIIKKCTFKELCALGKSLIKK